MLPPILLLRQVRDAPSNCKAIHLDILADARFEVLGSPFSLLSASISASQNLYTRKGTLLGFNGKPENVQSFLLTFFSRLVADTQLGGLHTLLTRTLPTNPLWHTLCLPARHFHHSLHRTHIHQILHHIFSSRASGR